jgi:2'-5' RNA ligase
MLLANEFVRFNIALKPPIKIAEKAMALSQEIGKGHKAFFVLDSKTVYPHITLYSPEYPKKNFDKILIGVKELAKRIEHFNLTYQQFITKQGFINISFNLSPEIKKLHEEIVAKFNPLREGHYKKKYDAPDYRMELSPEKIANIAKYGYPAAMDLYYPHLTIIRLEDEKEAEAVTRNLAWDIHQFTAATISVYKMGEHGTCVEPILDVRLK